MNCVRPHADSLPTQARAYKPTGANANCCWFAEGFESVPCGIGFGGQVGHFGLFVAESMDSGHSRMSATFNNPPLLGDGPGGAFEVDAVEAWAVDADALAEAEEAAARAARRAASGSVLDTHAQDRKFMQLALGGRGSASEGVR